MKYFTLQELTASATAKRKGIANIPNSTETAALLSLVHHILDPLREAYGMPIIVNSAFRCVKLNRAVGGTALSQHCKGQAADIRTVENTKESNYRLFQLIQKLGLPFDQLIDEYNYSWIHVSFSPRNRRQIIHIK